MFLISFIIDLLCYQTLPDNLFNSFQCTQLITVISESDTCNTAMLSFFNYDKAAKKWVGKFDSIPVNIGKAGFAWGEGLQTQKVKNPFHKHEGDSKAPAGIFYLRTAFGYAPPSEFINPGYPYQQINSSSICVDDAASKYYNSLITQNNANAVKDWKSAEAMKRHDELYKWGIFIGYNDAPVKKQNGSCIFFHIWRGPGRPTVGCTSLSEANLLRLLKELRSSAKPIVVQGSREQYALMKKFYQLP